MAGFRSVDPSPLDDLFKKKPEELTDEERKAIGAVIAPKGDSGVVRPEVEDAVRAALYREDDPARYRPATSAPGTADKPTIPTPDSNDEPDLGPAVGPADPTPAELAAANPGKNLAPVKPAVVAARAPAPANATPPTDRDDEGNRIEPAQEPVHPVAAALQAQGASPAVSAYAAYLADKRKAQDELKGAQADAAHRTALAQAENTIKSAFTSEGADMRQARLAAAQQPVLDVQARAKAGREALQDAVADMAFKKSVDADDAGSEVSKRTQALLGQLTGKGPEAFAGIPASAFPQYQELVKQQMEREKATAETARDAAKNEAHLKGIAMQQAGEDRRHAGGGNGKELGDAESKALGNLKSAHDDISGLSNKTGGLGPISTLWSKVPNTDDAVWQSERSALKDSIAGALAGGGRPTAVLTKLVEDALPNIGDSEDTKARKKANLLRLTASKYNGQLDSFKRSGRNVSRYEPIGDEPGQAGGDVDTRVIGGKTYVKQGGQWHEVL